MACVTRSPTLKTIQRVEGPGERQREEFLQLLREQNRPTHLSEKDVAEKTSAAPIFPRGMTKPGCDPWREKEGLAAQERLLGSCRRRLPCLLVKLRMAQSLRHAVTFVEQGHVRVGPEVVTDPALLIPRAVEDFITWVDASRIRQKVLDYNEERDDFDLAA
ncbi:PREDICTED: U3 small nucleolar ribonucleoprotein protein IMP3 [Nipponia nippon]|uniref:U3 small nucleolar ribonucleoprotein protein IMP3 n=1 Tax=Nipponia nippon TaxID=128390 RepID=UPI00051195D3|nr:PREDICTED: U3 small nucleolar ribonucleoprotein protein IMP3 [Nipponia nippon]